MKDKRTKNFYREIVQEGKELNQIIIHDDVPFFWDNWDIMHHAYETKWKEISNALSHKIDVREGYQIELTFSF